MALQKKIVNARTGHANEYWRLTVISIDALAGVIHLVLSGYATAEARLLGRQPDDRRDWMVYQPMFAAFALRAAKGTTVYDVNAIASYDVIRSVRRPIPPGTVLNDDGSVTLPTGETFAANDVDNSTEHPTVPSEFADAENV